MIICSDCNRELPSENFYLHSDTRAPYGRCKKCHTKKTNSYKNQQPRDNEIYVFGKLQKIGVPIMFGKQFSDKQYKNVDLVAYGKYKVECKLIVNNRIWLTKKQLRENYADYLILLYGKKMYLMPYSDIFDGCPAGQRTFTIPESDIQELAASPEKIKQIFLKGLA